MIRALSVVMTTPLMTSTGSAAGTVTLTARYSLDTVSVTGTVAVVVLAAKAVAPMVSSRAAASTRLQICRLFISFPFREEGRLI